MGEIDRAERVGNWDKAGGQIAVGFLILPGLAAFLWWVILSADRTDWALTLCIGVPTLLFAVVMADAAARGAVLWVEVGPRLRYCTPLGVRSRDWGDVRACGFEDEERRVETAVPGVDLPLPTHRILAIRLARGPELRVRVRPASEARIRAALGRWQPAAEPVGAPDRGGDK
jgi:hypothetical protein